LISHEYESIADPKVRDRPMVTWSKTRSSLFYVIPVSAQPPLGRCDAFDGISKMLASTV
jgi:hypothetical protein